MVSPLLYFESRFVRKVRLAFALTVFGFVEHAVIEMPNSFWA
jgi:hypothetical protein